jgi:anti-sigma regulatory factor (Ser/Thr protein kinase)
VNLATRLPHHPRSISKARRAVDELAGTLDDGTVSTLRLLVSELVTNSVAHGRPRASGDVELSISARHGRVRVEVADGGPGFGPRARTEGQDQGSGWGLHLVEAMSHRWGTEGGAGTCVWFEIDAAPAGPRRRAAGLRPR